MKQTPQYQLCQWEKMDRILMEDFNRDNAKVEAALAKQDAALEKYAASLTKFGNCRLWFTTYKGTGQTGADHPNTLTFPGIPLAALIISSVGEILPLVSGMRKALYHAGGTASEYITASWSGNTASWYCSGHSETQMNRQEYTYYVLAFYQADAE